MISTVCKRTIWLLLIFGTAFNLMGQNAVPPNSQTQVTTFKLTPNGADILLEWEMKNEEGVSEFQVYRKINNEPTLTFVANLMVNGSLKYKFLDDDIFKQSGRIIQYELHVIKDGEILKFASLPLAHTPTSIQRTWGSIKSLFR